MRAFAIWGASGRRIQVGSAQDRLHSRRMGGRPRDAGSRHEMTVHVRVTGMDTVRDAIMRADRAIRGLSVAWGRS